MAAMVDNPLVKILRISSVVLALILLLEIVFLGVARQLFNTNNDHKVFSYDVEPPQIIQFPARDSFQEAVSRSLFSWNRRPEASDKQPASEQNISAIWQLTGVVNTGYTTYAMFSETAGTRRVRLESGMYLENWKIAAITSDQVRLENGDREEVFDLKETSAAPSSTTGDRAKMQSSAREAQSPATLDKARNRVKIRANREVQHAQGVEQGQTQAE